MSALAAALVFGSAITHATWNLLAKQVEGGAAFIWLFDLVAVVVYAPLVAVTVAIQGAHLGTTGLLLIITSSSLHTGYFIALNRVYGAGDLSLVYPLARGTGPLLATGAAILFFGERPHPLAVVGALCVVGGAVSLGLNPRELLRPDIGAAVAFALATGAFIATYTLVDKQAVSTVGMAPLFYNWAVVLGSSLWLSPVALQQPQEIRRLWRLHRGAVLGIGILSPLSYILFLSALVFSPVSYIAPAREIGVLFGALLGFRVLGEGDVRRRLGAAVLMVAGVLLLVV